MRPVIQVVTLPPYVVGTSSSGCSWGLWLLWSLVLSLQVLVGLVVLVQQWGMVGRREYCCLDTGVAMREGVCDAFFVIIPLFRMEHPLPLLICLSLESRLYNLRIGTLAFFLIPFA